MCARSISILVRRFVITYMQLIIILLKFMRLINRSQMRIYLALESHLVRSIRPHACIDSLASSAIVSLTTCNV